MEERTMAKRKRYLTMDEKRQLALEGKPVPICVYPDYKAEKRRKKELERLARIFHKNI
jgi:hypothetical protein